jgi:hypothetical protein
MGADDLLRVAHAAAIDGVDLDLGGSPIQRWLANVERQAYLDHGGISSVWVPAATSDYDDLLGRMLVRRGSMAIVEEEKGSTPNGRAQLAAAIRLRRLVQDEARIALAVRPRNPEAGRAHLARLSLLRNIAEEWDLDLALDLSGSVDWLWEAEAAVFRLSPRLRMLRINYPLPTLDAHTRTRLTQRTIAACVDAGFEGTIAIVCPMPIWRWRSLSALERSVSMAVERLSGRFGITPIRPFQDLPQRSSTPW